MQLLNARRVRDSLENIEDFFFAREFGKYAVGFVATEYLVSLTSEEALWEFYRQLASNPSWPAAFAHAFGMTTDDFYESFEPYRVQVAPPLPTVSGVVRGPEWRTGGRLYALLVHVPQRQLPGFAVVRG